MKVPLFKKLWLLLWLLFAGGAFPSNTWGYDAQPSYLGTGYDLCSASATDYYSGPVLIGNEQKARGRAGCAVFVKFAEFLAADSGVLNGANYAQRTFSSTFSSGGTFAGQTVEDVAAALRSGTLSPADVPIQYIVQDGN